MVLRTAKFACWIIVLNNGNGWYGEPSVVVRRCCLSRVAVLWATSSIATTKPSELSLANQIAAADHILVSQKKRGQIEYFNVLSTTTKKDLYVDGWSAPLTLHCMQRTALKGVSDGDAELLLYIIIKNTFNYESSSWKRRVISVGTSSMSLVTILYPFYGSLKALSLSGL